MQIHPLSGASRARCGPVLQIRYEVGAAAKVSLLVTVTANVLPSMPPSAISKPRSRFGAGGASTDVVVELVGTVLDVAGALVDVVELVGIVDEVTGDREVVVELVGIVELELELEFELVHDAVAELSAVFSPGEGSTVAVTARAQAKPCWLNASGVVLVEPGSNSP